MPNTEKTDIAALVNSVNTTRDIAVNIVTDVENEIQSMTKRIREVEQLGVLFTHTQQVRLADAVKALNTAQEKIKGFASQA